MRIVSDRSLRDPRAGQLPCHLRSAGISKEAQDYYIALLEKTRATEDWQKFIAEDGLVDFWMTGEAAGKYVADVTTVYRTSPRRWV